MRAAIRLFSYFSLAAIVVWAIYNLYWGIRSTNSSMEYQKMQEDFQKSAEKDRRDNVLISEIDSLIFQKQYGTAISKINKYGAVIRFKNRMFLDNELVKIGYMYEKNNKIDSAFKIYSEAVRFSTDNERACAARGALYYKFKNYEAALSDFKNAADVSDYYCYNLGLVQQKLKLYQDADSSFVKYLQWDPKCKICKLKIDTMERQIAKYKAVATTTKHFTKADSVKKSSYSVYASKYHLDEH